VDEEVWLDLVLSNGFGQGAFGADGSRGMFLCSFDFVELP
jgi:hypothetical protein